MAVPARQAVVLAVACTVSAAPATAIGVSAHASSVHVIALKHMSFSPKHISVRKGDSVEFVWEDGSIPHNVTGAGFHSSTKTKGSYAVRLTRKGTYAFRCTIHSGMTATITVR